MPAGSTTNPAALRAPLALFGVDDDRRAHMGEHPGRVLGRRREGLPRGDRQHQHEGKGDSEAAARSRHRFRGPFSRWIGGRGGRRARSMPASPGSMAWTRTSWEDRRQVGNHVSRWFIRPRQKPRAPAQAPFPWEAGRGPDVICQSHNQASRSAQGARWGPARGPGPSHPGSSCGRRPSWMDRRVHTGPCGPDEGEHRGPVRGGHGVDQAVRPVVHVAGGHRARAAFAPSTRKISSSPTCRWGGERRAGLEARQDRPALGCDVLPEALLADAGARVDPRQVAQREDPGGGPRPSETSSMSPVRMASMVAPS